MKNIIKAVAVSLLAATIFTAGVFGTLAYLTDTEEVTNTFTVGAVDIKLDEAKVDTDGVPVDGADRVQTNEYHLLPGMTYTKDPTITVLPNSVSSYVRMILTVHNASDVQAIITNHELGDFSALIGGWDETVWLYEGFEQDDEENTISFEFRYKEPVETQEEELVLPPLFDTLIVPELTTGDELRELYEGGFKMVVTGHAIQKDNFASEDEAWEGFSKQVSL